MGKMALEPLTNRHVARKCRITYLHKFEARNPKSEKNPNSRMKENLGIKTAAELTRYAVKQGIAEP
jgi:hypothetical protein